MLVGITGGTGFVGRALALRHIEEGHAVRVISRRMQRDAGFCESIQLVRGDLSNSSSSELEIFTDNLDVLYHCAAELHDPEKMYAVNVTGTRNLCAAARGKIGHWVQLSSVGVYGPQSEGVVVEETPFKPVGPYERSKKESDDIVVDAARRGSFTYSILRPSNVFGEGMKNQSLFQLINMINRGMFFHIGAPGASANYIHVDNVVHALMLCAFEHASHDRCYNVSDHCTMEHFVAMIAHSLGCPAPSLRLSERLVRLIAKSFGIIPHFPLNLSRVDAMMVRSIYSIEKIRHDLGYSHIVSIEEGIRRLVMSWKSSTGSAFI